MNEVKVDETPEEVFKAKFKGIASLGYENGEIYSIEVRDAEVNEMIQGWKIVIKRAGEGMMGVCPYGSIGAFLSNWEILNG